MSHSIIAEIERVLATPGGGPVVVRSKFAPPDIARVVDLMLASLADGRATEVEVSWGEGRETRITRIGGDHAP